MGYTPVAEEAKRIRAAFKALGWNNRMVSVRARNFSMGSAIDVVVKSAKVNFAEAKMIAEDAESIRRCEVTGEILSGGNRYVHVRLSDEAKAELAAPWMERVEKALEKAQERDVHSEVEGSSISFAKVQEGQVQVWDGDRPGYRMFTGGPAALGELAAEVGRLEANRAFREALGTVDDLI